MFDVVVQRITQEASTIRSFELVPVDHRHLVSFLVGSHLSVHVPNYGIRQYSLLRPAADLRSFRIAVLHERAGRGGSRYLHEVVDVGDRLHCEAPRITFPLNLDADEYDLIAGGIGITAILPMAEALRDAGKRFRLTYLARSNRDAAFVRDVEQLVGPGKVRIHYSDDAGLFDLYSIVNPEYVGASIYCCGPRPLSDAIRKLTKYWPVGAVNFEHFSAQGPDPSGKAFRIVLAESGREILVPSDKTILNVLTENGFDLASMCEQGVCGSCLVPVIDGMPDHRDNVLSDAEKAANSVIAICCSRAKGERLVLDI